MDDQEMFEAWLKSTLWVINNERERMLAYEAWQAGRTDALAWRPISEAPKDGTEILGWRKDCGLIMVRWTSCSEFCTDSEIGDMTEEEVFKEDWFHADFIAGGRLEGSEVPTHFMLPEPPK